MRRTKAIRRAVVMVVGLLPVVAPPGAAVRGDEKVILADKLPEALRRFKVAPDGRRLYFAGESAFLVFDAAGTLVDQVNMSSDQHAHGLIPLPDGWFIACTGYVGGQLGLWRPDLTRAKVLVGKGVEEKVLRSDMTGWTSPLAVAVDPRRKLIFALDCTQAPPGVADPDWSRIAIFDFDGNYKGDINRYDAKDPKKKDERRTWYDDIAVDPVRQRVYVLAQRTGELLAFGYNGAPAGRFPAGAGGGIATFPDGRVAVGWGQTIVVLDPSLQPIRKLDLSKQGPRAKVGDIETDAAGRLYASVSDPLVLFLRWAPGLDSVKTISRDALRLEVEFPTEPIEGGEPFALKVRAQGHSAPGPLPWQVLARPSNGADLRWQALPSRLRGGTLLAGFPSRSHGFYELAVRFGNGPIDRVNFRADPYVQRTVLVMPRGATRSVAVVPDSGRRAYRQGEAISLHLVRRASRPNPVAVRLDLRHGGRTLGSVQVRMTRDYAGEVPAPLTLRLPPGRYQLVPTAGGHESYPLTIDLAPEQPPSPLQTILYHEFGISATSPSATAADVAERMAIIRDHLGAMANRGFSRQTDRRIAGMGPVAWRRDVVPVPDDRPGLPPPDALAIPTGGEWEPEYFLDQALRFGIRYDSQLLSHCSTPKFREPDLRQLAPVLQRAGQWLGRYPAFYGFNYNDEMFFANLTKEDGEWLERVNAERYAGRAPARAKLDALRAMYDRFDEAVRQAAPGARVTATPMWQFPAVEGSYAPVIYRGMDESYSHYLSEGFNPPWYPAHSASALKRPGLPLMAVCDGCYQDDGGYDYEKNVLQVAARGAQGVGVEHFRPFEDAAIADGPRVANRVARLHGPVFASVPPADEGAILYSLTQDLTESRVGLGTPHFVRVYALYGAGLMAGVPMSIVCEEDLAAGWLLDGKAPRVPMLFLTGQTQPLPAAVNRAIAAFVAAGGKVLTDADSRDYPGARRLDLAPFRIQDGFQRGYDGDGWFPLVRATFEDLASRLAREVGPLRRFPCQTDDPWVATNQFDGGAVRYVMFVAETSPYPWEPGRVWSLGDWYNQTARPRTVTATVPARPGVVYDVFEKARVEPKPGAKGSATLTVDLTTFPGRLYAFAPAPLGPPKVVAGVQGETLEYRVTVADEQGRDLRARVPLRLRLFSDTEAAFEVVRATEADGTYHGRVTLPATSSRWTLEATELLGGLGAAAVVAHGSKLPTVLTTRPDVDIRREEQLRELLRAAHGRIALNTPSWLTLHQGTVRALAAALERHGITLTPAEGLPKDAVPGVYLTAGFMDEGFVTRGTQDDLLGLSIQRGLLGIAPSRAIPGPGRGLITPVFSPRADQEHAIALLGGDARGLSRTLAAFADWLARAPAAAPSSDSEASPATPMTIVGQPARVAPVPPLREMVGVRLGKVAASPDGHHVLVTAPGYQRNLAVIADRGATAEPVRAVRVGQGPKLESPFLSADGAWMAGSSRTTARQGQVFDLIDVRTGRGETFAPFGDVGRQLNRFAVSERGDVVLATGSYGAVCWKRDGGTWREAWAIEDWKGFAKRDWPVGPLSHRCPQVHAFLPRGGDTAVLVRAEAVANAWISEENVAGARVEGVSLADGRTRWRFDVPISRSLLFPTLHTSPDGSRLLLQVQVGSWGKETFRYFSLVDGKRAGSWSSPMKPFAVALADATGWIAEGFAQRLLDVRRPDGSLVFSVSWPDQPVSLAFAADGRSLFVADDAGRLTLLNESGGEVWQIPLPCSSSLAVQGDRVYAAGWDGRLRSFTAAGRPRWTLDCTPVLNDPRPLELAARTTVPAAGTIHEAKRPPTTSATVPEGPNLLRGGQATLTVGGTPSWKSAGKVEIQPGDLTDGKVEPGKPWLPLEEQYWDAVGMRPAWAEVAFKKPTDVHSLTVYEDPKRPGSWPTEGLVQVWDASLQKWQTAAMGLFLDGPTNTYALDLKEVRKLRYLPWSSYYRNFCTSEIEVR